jgi:hypothetical protein
MSMITSVEPAANREIEPFDPAGTIAAFATICPCSALRVETVGIDVPVGHTVRYPRTPCGTTVTFTEYALALFGIEQGPSGTGTSRWLLDPLSDGAPKGPVKSGVAYAARVSIRRHGVIATNGKGPEFDTRGSPFEL